MLYHYDNDNENILFDHNIQIYINRSTKVYKPEYELGLETIIWLCYISGCSIQHKDGNLSELKWEN